MLKKIEPYIAAKKLFLAYRNGFFYVSAALRRKIEEEYGNPLTCNIFHDDEEGYLLFGFDPNDTDYALSENGNGGKGYKISFRAGRTLKLASGRIGLNDGRYDNMAFTDEGIKLYYGGQNNECIQ